MKNRRIMGTGAVALGLLSSVLATPSMAAEGLAIVDATVSVESLPTVVAPAGAQVLYRITVSNNGPAPIPVDGATVTDTLPSGFAFASATIDCTGTTSVSCTVPEAIPAAGSYTFDLRAATSTTPGLYTNHVAVAVGDTVSELLDDSANNTDEVDTEVLAGNTDEANAFVPGGGSLTFDGHVLSVPATDSQGEPVAGVFVTLSRTADHQTLNCDGGPCGQGLSVVYDEDEEDYQVTDPLAPVAVDVTFDYGPCYGLGGRCAQLYVAKPAEAGKTVKAVPNCDVPGSGAALVGGVYELCRDRVYKVGDNRIRQSVLMLTTDPDLLPPINLGK